MEETHNSGQRPSNLEYPKTRVVEGRQFIDTTSTTSKQSEDLRSQPEPSTSQTTEKKDEENNDDVVSFVAADLQERIRMTSPVRSADSGGVTTGSSSSSPSPYPPLLPDPQVLIGLEHQARQISVQLDRVMQEITGSLHGMTDLTAECAEVHKNVVKKTCDQVDASIKSTYQLLAKAEELSHALKPIPQLARQIKEIKRILDLFESHMQKTVG